MPWNDFLYLLYRKLIWEPVLVFRCHRRFSASVVIPATFHANSFFFANDSRQFTRKVQSDIANENVKKKKTKWTNKQANKRAIIEWNRHRNFITQFQLMHNSIFIAEISSSKLNDSSRTIYTGRRYITTICAGKSFLFIYSFLPNSYVIQYELCILFYMPIWWWFRIIFSTWTFPKYANSHISSISNIYTLQIGCCSSIFG